MAAAPPFEYAPAPEARETARLRDSYGIFVNGEFRAGTGESVATIEPSKGGRLAGGAGGGRAGVAAAGERDVAAAGAARRPADESVWRDLPGRELAKYLFRIARAVQER